jgi:hypothetical protein
MGLSGAKGSVGGGRASGEGTEDEKD